MKKYLTALLAAVLVLSFSTACAKGGESPASVQPSPAGSAAQETFDRYRVVSKSQDGSVYTQKEGEAEGLILLVSKEQAAALKEGQLISGRYQPIPEKANEKPPTVQLLDFQLVD